MFFYNLFQTFGQYLTEKIASYGFLLITFRLKDISLCNKHSCMNKEISPHSGCMKIGPRTKTSLKQGIGWAENPPPLTPVAYSSCLNFCPARLSMEFLQNAHCTS